VIIVHTQAFQTQSTLTSRVAILLISALLLILNACASTSAHNGRPAWIDNQSKHGLSAIGSASYDIFGESWARERAVKKALAELAIQKGSSVDVLGAVENKQVLSNGSFAEQASVTTHAVIKGQEIAINAKIKEYWKDLEGKKVWVLMVEE